MLFAICSVTVLFCGLFLAAQCQDLLYSPCVDVLPYSNVQFPNEFTHTQGEIINNFIMYNEVGTCHPNALEQLCRLYMPECEPVRNLPQCRNYCESVRDSCSGPFLDATGDTEWPSCDHLPYVNCTDSEGGKMIFNVLHNWINHANVLYTYHIFRILDRFFFQQCIARTWLKASTFLKTDTSVSQKSCVEEQSVFCSV